MIAVSSMTILSMEKVSAQTPTIYMQDTTSSAGLPTYSGRQIHAEYVSTSSILVGKQIDTMVVKLKRETLQTTGPIQIGVFNPDLSVKKLFGSMDASSLASTKTYTIYTFSLPAGQTFQISAGDRIGVKFAGGDSTNHVSVMTDRKNTFDSTNSYRTYYTTAWNDVKAEDLYMTLELVNSAPITGPITSSPDTIPPVITLLGYNPVTVQQGSSYIDAGATAIDNVDGTITPSIITTNPVNTSILGTYTVTYNVSDKAGNAALPVTRTVSVVAVGSPSPTTNIRVDSTGVQQFFAQKAGKQQIVMGTGDPNSIAGFGLDGGSKATPVTLGQFHYYTIQARSGGTSSGTQLTMRINLNPVGSSGSQVDWMTAEKQGYMVVPNDIDEFEQTGYFRIQSATQDDDISLKQGGQHTDTHPAYAGSFGMEVAYSGKYGKTAEKELNHPDYEFFNDPVALQTGSIVGKWIGVKEISRHTPSGQLYEVYVDLDPIDFATGLPKNNWQHLSTHLDDGKESGMYAGHITSWGKKYFTYRIDNAPNIDFALLSVHHIDTTTGQNIP